MELELKLRTRPLVVVLLALIFSAASVAVVYRTSTPPDIRGQLQDKKAMGIKLDVLNSKITIRGTVGEEVRADDFQDSLNELKGKSNIVIEIDSPGGSVNEGVLMHGMIENFEGHVTIRVDGLCASIATIIACAGDDVVMTESSEYMIHRCWTVAFGNCRDFRKMADIMDELDGDMAEVYAEKSGLLPGDIIKMMDAETYMSAQEALELGFVDAIIREGPEEVKACSDRLRAQRLLIKACLTI